MLHLNDREAKLEGLMPETNETRSPATFINEAYGTEHRLLRVRRDL